MAAQKYPFCNGSKIMADNKRIHFLNKIGFYNDIDFCFDTPYKYYDVSKETEIVPSVNGKFICVRGVCKRVTDKVCKNGSIMIKAELECKDQNQKPCRVFISYFGNPNMKQILMPLIEQKCIAAGKVNVMYGNYYISSPVLFQLDRLFTKKIITVYSKHKGISQEWMGLARQTALDSEPLEETIPEYIRKKYKVPGRREAVMQLHHPVNKDRLMDAVRRQLIEDLLYFACINERERVQTEKNSNCVVRSLEKTKQVMKSFPYDLTADQKNVLNAIVKQMMDGKRVSALVQGDVGCGKSIVAFLLMIAMAENGFQSVLMAPTSILAEQHYEELKTYADRAGLKTVLLTGKLTAAQKKKTLASIESGEAQLIVATHAAVSDSVTFKCLGLAVVDEEHRFGTRARNALLKNNCHSVNFTATPIPRTVAQTIYRLRDIYEIKTMPGGRQPVDTKVVNNLNTALETVKRELDKGHQAYIVCPYIDSDEENEDKCASVEEISEKCSRYLGIPVGTATGKDKDTENTLTAFKDGTLKVLCATTVIEVGVNVPNATVMVIMDAYRFGLAQLHQLRGRVGRGKDKGYCLLVSSHDATRLHVMEETTDGFVIAHADYNNRGGGNLFGIQQSGDNRFLTEAVMYPKYYKSLCNVAEEMVQSGEDQKLIHEMEKRSDTLYIKPAQLKLFSS